MTLKHDLGTFEGFNFRDQAALDWACFEKMESKIEVSLGFAGWS